MNLYKILFLSIILLTTASCVSQKQTSNNIQEVAYSAMTRGSSIKMKVIDTTFHYKNNEKKNVYTITKEQHKKLREIINEINLLKLNTFKAPSSDRAFDGAMHATILIKNNDTIYRSTTFDDGNPPKELKKLVDLLESFVK